MLQRFALNQKNANGKQSAELLVPGCGTKAQDDGPVAYIEIEDGKPVMYVWADIASEDPTHRIDLSDALESNRAEDEPARKAKNKAD